jgi:hypothetical protein
LLSSREESAALGLAGTSESSLTGPGEMAKGRRRTVSDDRSRRGACFEAPHVTAAYLWCRPRLGAGRAEAEVVGRPAWALVGHHHEPPPGLVQSRLTGPGQGAQLHVCRAPRAHCPQPVALSQSTRASRSVGTLTPRPPRHACLRERCLLLTELGLAGTPRDLAEQRVGGGLRRGHPKEEDPHRTRYGEVGCVAGRAGRASRGGQGADAETWGGRGARGKGKGGSGEGQGGLAWPGTPR